MSVRPSVLVILKVQPRTKNFWQILRMRNINCDNGGRGPCSAFGTFFLLLHPGMTEQEQVYKIFGIAYIQYGPIDLCKRDPKYAKGLPKSPLPSLWSTPSPILVTFLPYPYLSSYHRPPPILGIQFYPPSFLPIFFPLLTEPFVSFSPKGLPNKQKGSQRALCPLFLSTLSSPIQVTILL